MRTTSKESLIDKLSAALWLCAILISPTLQAEPTWVTQQGARLVIGQNSFTRSNPISSRAVIGSAGGVAVGGDTLVIAEGNRIGATPINNRVLIYDNLSGFIPEPEAELPQGGDQPWCPACVGLANVVVGQDNFTTSDPGTLNGRMKAPSGVATDGTRLAVADTNNNRVLLWHTMPQTNGTPPNVVLGQADLTDNFPRTTATGMRGPQGVWIDSGRLFVADTQNSRVLIWNSFPSSNGQAPDVVVGQPDFTTRPEPDLTQSNYLPSAQRLLNPASVQVYDNKMFVADLGFDRVMIYLSIPTGNHAPADVVVGQPDFNTYSFVRPGDPGVTTNSDGIPVNAAGHLLVDRTGQSLRRAVVALCEQISPFADDGTITPDDLADPLPIFQDPEIDADDLRYPTRCGATLAFPRFALSDGTRLFISDSGNDRVLVFDQIPLENGATADVVIGQPDFITLTDSDGAGSLRVPGALAHDGENLYVADPLGRRVLVFTPGEPMIVADGIRNGASFDIKANGFLEWNGTAVGAQTAAVNISGQEHEIENIEAGTTAAELRDMFVELINNREDSLVTAEAINGPGTLSRAQITFSGETRAGDLVTLHIGDRSYSVEMVGPPSDPGPYIAIDRLLFVINEAGGDPEVTVRRLSQDINTFEIVSNSPGDVSNGLPVSIDIPSGSPLIAEFLDDEGEGNGATSGELSGGAFPAYAWLTAVAGGRAGNGVTIQNSITGNTATSTGITAEASGVALAGGTEARYLAPGTFASIFGEGFYEQELVATSNDGSLPKELGGVRVYVNGIQAPISSLSPNQVNFQVPWEVIEDVAITNTGISTYVWRRMDDDSVIVSAARANPLAKAAPGLFAYPGPEPRRAVAVHAQAIATADIEIVNPDAVSDPDETVPAGVTITINVEDSSYTYTSQTGDTATSVRNALVDLINGGDGDANVTATGDSVRFFSAQARIDLSGEPKAGDVVNIDIGSPIAEDDDNPDDDDDSLRRYSYTVQEGDSLATIRNLLIFQINSGLGDVDISARELLSTFETAILVIARQIGTEGDQIRFRVSTSEGSGVQVSTDQDEGFLERGGANPTVKLSARVSGKEGNKIAISASSSTPDTLSTRVQQETLCCGNVPFSLIDEENPAVPNEIITLFASGMGFTSPLPSAENLLSGQPTPASPLFRAPFDRGDFVSARMGVDRGSVTIDFAGLMPGFVGIYQINLRVHERLPENPRTPFVVVQRNFVSNTVTIPVKPLQPRDPVIQ